MKVFRRLRSLAFAFCAAVLLLPATALAASSAVVRSAAINIAAKGNTSTVQEKIVVGGFASGAGFSGIMYSYPDAKVNNISWTINGQSVQPQATTTGNVVKYTFKAPGSSNATIGVHYSVQRQGSFRVPIFVPSIATKGGTRDVAITFAVPPGQYLQGDSFPYVANLNARTVHLQMEDVPSFARFHYASNRPGFLTTDSLISGIVIVVMLLVILAWALTERQAMRKGDVGV